MAAAGLHQQAVVLALSDDRLAEVAGRSLGAAILDQTAIGRQINNRLLTAPVYATLSAIYFCLNRALSAAMRLLEHRCRFNRIVCFFAR